MDIFIPLSIPNIKENEKKYMNEAIEQGWVSTGGAFIDLFEKNIAKYLGVSSAVACQSGTAGLHLALIALGVCAGQEVLVPALTFIASVNPVRYVCAEPVFMDCDDSLCMDMNKLQHFCENECELRKDNKLYNKKSGKHVSTVMVVHVFGNIADMVHLKEIASKYNLFIIEDAAEALGSHYTSGKYAGKHAGTLGDIGVYSFNGNKIITTGGGGMVVANDADRLKRIKHLSTQAKTDSVYFVHDEVGFNYRMTNVQAAIGVGQLENLEAFINTKSQNYQLYHECGVQLIPFKDEVRPNFWFYSYLTNKRDYVIRHLELNNIQSRPVWYLINKLPVYEKNQDYMIERALWYHQRIVNLPCSSSLSPDDVGRVSDCVLKIEKTG